MAYNPTINHVAIVQAVRASFADARLSADQCALLCHEVARRCIAAGESDAGVMFKTSGNYGEVAGARYSVDIILYHDSAVYVDCLRDAGDRNTGPGLAQPAWQGPNPGSVANWAPPVGQAPPPDPPNPPDPPSNLEERVAALEVAMLRVEARFQAISRAAAGQ